MSGSKMDLGLVRIRASHLTNKIFIARYAKNNDRVAIDKRECSAELAAALIESMLEIGPSGMPGARFKNGAYRDIKVGSAVYRLSIQIVKRGEVSESDKS